MAPVLLKYHGGQWELARWIINHFPSHLVYVEPFGGSAAVLLQKPRSHNEVYNDLNDEVVGVFRILRDGELSARLVEQLKLTPFSRRDLEQSCEPSTDPVEQARRSIFRAFAGFGSDGGDGEEAGLFRANHRRAHRVPANDWANYPTHLAKAIERFRRVVIENRPAVDVIAQHDALTTLFYVDPPARNEMSDKSHRDLAKVLRGVQGHVVLSGLPSPMELLSEVVDREAGKSRRRRQKGRERILRVTTNTPTPR